MTLNELRTSKEDFVNAKVIASILKCDECALHMAATEEPEKLGFPCTVIGKRVRFPREAFIAFCEGKREALANG